MANAMKNHPAENPDFEQTIGTGGLPKLILRSLNGAQAEIYQHGAQVVSWIPAGDRECLFLSQASRFSPGAPIRGGIPVIFPQFAAMGPLPFHGLARLATWDFAGVQVVGDKVTAMFRLDEGMVDHHDWPNIFIAELAVTIGGSRMDVALSVTNPGAEPFDFTASLHTYLTVDDLNTTVVRGLESVSYRDAAAGGVERTGEAAEIGFTAMVDRIYYSAPAETRLVESGRSIRISQQGFVDTVVWNPAAEKCATMPDMEPDDYRRFVCVEAATVGAPVQLAPGAHWEGRQMLAAES